MSLIGHDILTCDCDDCERDKKRIKRTNDALNKFKAVGFGCLNTDGHIEYTAPYASMCHEHINDGINNFGLDDMAKLKVVPIFYKIEA
ncbi:hypothetical protein [Methylotenera sp.]|uniref:hypothetical protein n=1 Tax=Methylotenera sp. TaxID=2051956 RepID=UPI0027330188|nr:hypothetical protein [Methylotenera sp.]MDP3308297.1 hypothetical protein [Methylotenera sp.]